MHVVIDMSFICCIDFALFGVSILRLLWCGAMIMPYSREFISLYCSLLKCTWDCLLFICIYPSWVNFKVFSEGLLLFCMRQRSVRFTGAASSSLCGANDPLALQLYSR